MSTRSRPLIALLALLALALSSIGCSAELGEGTQFAGQECFTDDNCVEGLVCVERQCRTTNTHRSDEAPDAGDAEDAPDPTDGPAPRDVPELTDAPGGDNGDECCPGGCGDQEVCWNCTCRSYDPNECSFQFQPCETGADNEDYECIRLSDRSGSHTERRCLGRCDPDAESPSDTCPDDANACVLETSVGNDLCLTRCENDEACPLKDGQCMGPSDDEEKFCAPPGIAED